MKIKSVFKEYSLEFVDSIEYLINEDNNIFFVIDKKIYTLYVDIFKLLKHDRYLLIEALEKNKNMETVLLICEKIMQLNSKRNTTLISIGGGIIQDITGFVANVLYRGIKWIYIPTTLLAMCDSCIGGKSSLNYKEYKNIIGSFYPPDRIIMYLEFLNTLSLEDYYSGLGEIVKFNIIAGENGINNIECNINALIERDYNILHEFIKNSLNFKKLYIEEDEFDQGKRIILNFAHTLGHAFESSSLYQIPHGTAVVLGMITINNISLQRNIINTCLTERIERICKKIIPIKIDNKWLKINIIMNAIKNDKKQLSSSIRDILFDNNYNLTIHEDIKIEEISKAIEHLIKILYNC